MDTRNPFSTSAYKAAFAHVLSPDEYTMDDECMVDMSCIAGQKQMYFTGRHPIYTDKCKGFTATTNKHRLLVAEFDLMARYHTCYAVELNDIRDLKIQKMFGGMNISFSGTTQLGVVKVDMDIQKRLFGTDLKNQKQHLERLIEHLNGMSAVEEKAKTAAEEQKSESESKPDKSAQDELIRKGQIQSGNPMGELFTKVRACCDKIEESDINWHKIFSPLEKSAISEWENSHCVVLPEAYKNWLMLSNGLDVGMIAELVPLEAVTELSVEDYEGYFSVGSYIGDGSMLVVDGRGKFYRADHAYGLEEEAFEHFIEEWVIPQLEDEMRS